MHPIIKRMLETNAKELETDHKRLNEQIRHNGIRIQELAESNRACLTQIQIIKDTLAAIREELNSHK